MNWLKNIFNRKEYALYDAADNVVLLTGTYRQCEKTIDWLYGGLFFIVALDEMNEKQAAALEEFRTL